MGAYRHLFLVYGALLALLAITTGTALLALGPFNPAINFGVSVAKTALIFWFFMELRAADGLTRLVALAAFYWLSIMLALGVTDWLTR